MIVRLLLAALLVAHGLIHVLFLVPAPPATADGPSWPFRLTGSWVTDRVGLSSDVARTLAIALVSLTIVGFCLAALVVMGLLPAAVWPAAVIVGSTSSIALLAMSLRRSLIVGFAIDAGLLWAALVAGWAPTATALP